MELANEDIMKIDSVIKEPLEKCLLYLSYKSDKVITQDLIHRESLKKMA